MAPRPTSLRQLAAGQPSTIQAIDKVHVGLRCVLRELRSEACAPVGAAGKVDAEELDASACSREFVAKNSSASGMRR